MVVVWWWGYCCSQKLVLYNFLVTVKATALIFISGPCADREGGGGAGVLTPSEKAQNTGFLSKTGPDRVKNHKATKPAFNVGPSSARKRNAI